VTAWYTDVSGQGTDNLGRLWLVDTGTGERTPFGGPIDLGPYGMQTGVATDAAGYVYVAVATFASDPAPGVVRLAPDGTPVRLLTLPADAFPNGVMVQDGYVYVTDSGLGAVWRAPTDVPTVATSLADAWLVDDALAPAPLKKRYPPIGADGIAAAGGDLLVANWTTGTILRVPVRTDGSAGPLAPVAQDKRLVEADGIAVDWDGRVWVTVNARFGSLVVVDPGGEVSVARIQNSWLDYPTQPVLGADGELFVLNGSYFASRPDLVAFEGLRNGC
jgi:sugar lactone lactonase YvrE